MRVFDERLERLDRAVKQGDEEEIRAAAAAFGDLSLYPEEAESALSAAVCGDHGPGGAWERVRLLVALGARVHAFPPDHCETSMHWAANHGYTEVLETLLRAGGDAVLGVFDDFDFTPLHHAAWKGHVHAVRFLLDAGSDVNSMSDQSFHKTPLITAVQEGWRPVVELLLARGADPTIPDSLRVTPLEHAVDWNPEPKTPEQRRIVELLEQHPKLRKRDEFPDR